MSWRALRGGSVLLLLLAPLGPARAAGEARDSYRDGQDALKDGRFQAAEEAFRAAIAERAEEKVGGAFRRGYLPHFELGVALDEQNRCREALTSWAESERQGEIQRSRDDYAELVRRKQACAAKVRALDAARSEAEQALARARKAEQAAARLQAKGDLAAVWSEGSPSLAGRQQGAHQRLEQAALRLEATTDRHGVAPLEEIKALANQVASDFDAVAADAESRLVALQNEASSALERLQKLEQQAQAELAAAAYLAPYPPELARRLEALQGALRAVADGKDKASPAGLTALRGQLEEELKRFSLAAQPPPESLRTAVAAFFGGDYERVLAVLAAETYRDPRAVAQACLLRAASRHALWVLGGESDAALAAALVDDVARCRALEKPPVISARFFSPRFVRFFVNPPQPPASE